MSYISRTERVLIVIVSGLLVLFVYGQIFTDIVNNYNHDVRHQQDLLSEQAGGSKEFINIAASGYSTGLFHLMSLPVFLALILGQKFYIAFVLVVTYFITLLYSHYLRFRDLESALMGWRASEVNLIVLAFLLVMVVWITSIVIRSLLQTKRLPKLD